MNAISISNLKKHFSNTKAVDGISFEVERGEIFGFLGPNGAGKTTTIRCMLDFIRPSSGSIKILGMDAQKEGVELKKRLGYLAPEPRLYENLSGKEHIDLINNIKGKGSKTEELVEKLKANINIPVKTLSTGNKQKISLILALMHDPDVVIMDEPTTGLDPILQNTIYEILTEMKDRNKTIFMSSHNLSEVEKICQRAAIIREGKLVAIEDISKLNQRRMYKVRASFNNENDTEGIEKIEGVTVETLSGGDIHLTSRGNPANLIKFLAGKEIVDLEIEHAGLEETFMNFYKGGRK